MKKTRVIILRTAGTNCDQETAFAFQSCGAQADCVHINKLLRQEVSLEDYHILAIPGGFTYGDDIESGRILANELRLYLSDQISRFINDKKLIIGICNGFQVLVRAGILPGLLNTCDKKDPGHFQQVSLITNDSGKFEDRWVHLKIEGRGPWLEGLKRVVFFPVAHAEGKFIAREDMLKELNENHQVAFRYCAGDGTNPVYPRNPNGSSENIAGITDPTGRILGLMPHPERHFLFRHHPYWTRLKPNGQFGEGAGIFKNGVEYIKKHLL